MATIRDQLLASVRSNDIENFKTTLNKFKKEERKQLVNCPFEDMCTFLMAAACRGRIEIVEYLINDCDCDVNFKNISEWTALMFAAFEGHLQIVETLLNKGADINAVNSFRSTALHLATEKCHKDIVLKLLDRGATTTIKDNACWTALEVAKHNKLEDIANLLQNKMPRDFLVNEELLRSVQCDDVVSYKKILQENNLETSEVLDTLFDGTVSWLMCASYHGSKEIVKYLLKLKCDVNLKSSAGWTSLMFAAHVGNRHIVKLLLRAMPDIDATNNLGSTALHLAMDKGHVNVVKQLIGQQARTDIKDSAGLTAFQIARTGDVCEEAKKIISKILTLNFMSNSFRHIATFIDFAYDYKASSLQIKTIDIRQKTCLQFEYNHMDIANETLSTTLIQNLRESLRCLGNDVLVFTKNKGSAAVTYLSQAYLQSTDDKIVVAPRVEYKLPELSRCVSFDNGTLRSVLKNPIIKTEDQLKSELRTFCESPSSETVMINIIKLKDEQLIFHVDKRDILCTSTSPGNIQSLRDFCRVLYLNHHVKIFLRDIEVNSILDDDYLNDSKNYKCSKGQEISLDITFGFPNDDENTEATGLMIYHKNRLVKIKKVQTDKRLIGVVNIDYLTPTAYKHNFIKNEKYREAMKLLEQKRKHYLKQAKENAGFATGTDSSLLYTSLYKGKIRLHENKILDISAPPTLKSHENETYLHTTKDKLKDIEVSDIDISQDCVVTNIETHPRVSNVQPESDNDFETPSDSKQGTMNDWKEAKMVRPKKSLVRSKDMDIVRVRRPYDFAVNSVGSSISSSLTCRMQQLSMTDQRNVYIDDRVNRNTKRIGKPFGSMQKSSQKDFPKGSDELYEDSREQKEKEWNAQSHLSEEYIEKYKGNVILFKEIKILTLIGQGEFGDVYLAQRKDGKTVAVKKLNVEPVSPLCRQLFENEIQVLCTLQHPNIVTFLGACVVTPNLAIIMEYMDMSLYDALHIKQVVFAEQDKLIIMRDVAQGIDYLHEKRIAHCALKTQNVLLNNVPDQEITYSHKAVIAKITDFGLSIMKKNMESSASASTVYSGTLRYSAPEVLRGELLDADKLMKADVYSEGLVILELLVEKIAFKDLNLQQLSMQTKLKLSIPSGLKLDKKLEEMLEECWSSKPEERPSARSVCLVVNNIHKLFIYGERE